MESRKRTSTLANTISFTHTRQTAPQDDQPQSFTTNSTGNNVLTRASTNLYQLQKNNSSSTLHSISQTLSSVGFTPLVPVVSDHSSSGSASPATAATANTNNSSSPQLPSMPLISPINTFSNASAGTSSLRSPLTPTAGSSSLAFPSTSSSSSTKKLESAISRAKQFAKTKAKRTTKSGDEPKHHHHNFLKKGTHSGVSSSQSNSKLETGSTLYSFDPSSILEGDAMLKKLQESNLRNLSFEERDQMADDLWASVVRTCIPLFQCENSRKLKLRTPIEDINKMLEVFIRLRLENNTTTTSILSELMEFLRNGLSILENELSFCEKVMNGHEVFPRLAVTWDYFFRNIYHYLLAILLPLQMEIDKPFQPSLSLSFTGLSSSNSRTTWNEAFSDMVLSTKNLVLVAFRDFVVLPYFGAEINVPPLEQMERGKLVMCFGMIKGIGERSYSQRVVDHILGLLLEDVKEL